MKNTLILLMMIITVPLLAQDITNKLGGKTAAETYDVTDSGDALLLRVQGDGNVGIGTTSPSVKLDVNGPIKGTGLSISGPVVGSGFTNWDTNSSNDLTTSTTFAGDVSGTYSATVVGNDSHKHADATVSDYISIDNGRLYAPSGSGSVGIGTTTPDEKLHVAGNMRLNGSFEDKDGDAGTAGQILSSTATGTDWVTAPAPALGDLNNGPPYVINTYYTAATDGFILVQAQILPSVIGGFWGYLKSGSSSPTAVAKVSGEDSANISMMFACKKGDQWQVVGSELRGGFTYIYWMPFGT